MIRDIIKIDRIETIVNKTGNSRFWYPTMSHKVKQTSYETFISIVTVHTFLFVDSFFPLSLTSSSTNSSQNSPYYPYTLLSQTFFCRDSDPRLQVTQHHTLPNSDTDHTIIMGRWGWREYRLFYSASGLTNVYLRYV